jgi:hypothetical protein
MEGMVRHLESAGFETNKIYNAQKGGYDFKISKDKIRVDGFFLYPGRDNPESRDAKQRKFLDEIIGNWHNAAVANLKGENKMDFMDCIYRGGSVYLNVNGEEVPVRIETIETSPFEYTRFEGRILGPDNKRYIAKTQTPSKNFPGIKAVHFSGPCTVIVWDDKTKTVVRCKDENIDYEKGFAMAVAKKVFGTNESGSNYYDVFKKYLPKPETPEEETPTEEETTITETPEEVIPNVEPAE